MQRTDRLAQQRWEMKREVFNRALKLIDAWWSNIDWLEGEPDRQQKPTIEEAREIHNLMSLTCQNKETISIFLNCLNTKSKPSDPNNTNMGMIAGLRGAMRAELDFERLHSDKDAAWLVRLTMKD